MSRTEVSNVELPQGTAHIFKLPKSHVLRIEEVSGAQVATLNMFSAYDRGERFDAAYTRWIWSSQGQFRLAHGSILYSRRGTPMLTISDYSTDVHDISGFDPGCSRLTFQITHKIESVHANCQDLLAERVEDHGLTADDLHESFNIFQSGPILDDGRLTYLNPVAKAGDFIELKAEQDLLVVIAACPDELSKRNGGELKPVSYTHLPLPTTPYV